MSVVNMDAIIIESVHDVFETLIYVLPEEQPVLKIKRSHFSGEVIASLQISGGINGIVVVVCPKAVAAKLTQNMLGADETPEDEAEISDCIGEIVNMIAGNIKTRCIDSGVTFNLAIPVVMCGREMVMRMQEELHGLQVPFVVEGEEMYVALLYKDEPGVTP
jgi:CheY-specific phosphatase CheX